MAPQSEGEAQHLGVLNRARACRGKPKGPEMRVAFCRPETGANSSELGCTLTQITIFSVSRLGLWRGIRILHALMGSGPSASDFS